METLPQMVSCDSKKATHPHKERLPAMEDGFLPPDTEAQAFRKLVTEGYKRGLQSVTLSSPSITQSIPQPNNRRQDTPGSLEPKEMEESPEYPSGWKGRRRS